MYLPSVPDELKSW